jgi:hypothetical protein
MSEDDRVYTYQETLTAADPLCPECGNPGKQRWVRTESLANPHEDGYMRGMASCAKEGCKHGPPAIEW